MLREDRFPHIPKTKGRKWGRISGLKIQRTMNAEPAAIEDMGVDHGCFDIGMAEEFLDGADIVAGFEQVGGEGVTEGVATDGLGYAGNAGRPADFLLQAGYIRVMTAEDARARIDREPVRGKDVLPLPLAGGGGILALKGIRQVDAAGSERTIGIEHTADTPQMILQRSMEAIREDRDAVLEAFAVADEDLAEVEIRILDAQAEDLHEAHSAAVKELGHEKVRAGEPGQQGEDFLLGKHDGEAGGAFGAHEMEGRIQLFAQDVAEEEDQRVHGLVLGGGGNLFADGEVGEKSGDLRFGQPFGREGGMEGEESADPIHIGLFGADGIMPEADAGAEAIEQDGSGNRCR
jgi:hypothetical protein